MIQKIKHIIRPFINYYENLKYFHVTLLFCLPGYVILLNLGNKFSYISTNAYVKLFDIISDLPMTVDVTNYHAYNTQDSK